MSSLGQSLQQHFVCLSVLRKCFRNVIAFTFTLHILCKKNDDDDDGGTACGSVVMMMKKSS